MLTDEQLQAVLALFANHVNTLTVLATELRPDDRTLQDLCRKIQAALKTNDISALRLAGEQLHPHTERILNADDTLLDTLQASVSSSSVLMPLIDQFRESWPNFKTKRRAKIHASISGILTCYMIVHGGVAPGDVGIEI